MTSSASQMPILVGMLLTLMRSCLLFDFIGMCTDETAEDRTVHVPANWRDIITSPTTLPVLPPPLLTLYTSSSVPSRMPQLFFDLYLHLDVPCSVYAMSCLVQLTR